MSAAFTFSSPMLMGSSVVFLQPPRRLLAKPYPAVVSLQPVRARGSSGSEAGGKPAAPTAAKHASDTGVAPWCGSSLASLSLTELRWPKHGCEVSDGDAGQTSNHPASLRACSWRGTSEEKGVAVTALN